MTTGVGRKMSPQLWPRTAEHPVNIAVRLVEEDP